MRVPRTFAFVDLSGFTNYTAAFGDDAAGRSSARSHRCTRDRQRARACASPSGSVTAAWSCPIEQSNAVAFALDLEHRAAEVCAPLSLRVGMATGHALLFEGDDYIGSAVNMAARLCDAAGPFEVLMPTMQIERLPAGVTAHAHEPVELRGFPGPIDVVELGGTARTRGQHRHRRAVDPQPVRVIRGAVVPTSRLDRARFHEDLALLGRPRRADGADHARLVVAAAEGGRIRW